LFFTTANVSVGKFGGAATVISRLSSGSAGIRGDTSSRSAGAWARPSSVRRRVVEDPQRGVFGRRSRW
jgi:hypothetical protein